MQRRRVFSARLAFVFHRIRNGPLSGRYKGCRDTRTHASLLGFSLRNVQRRLLPWDNEDKQCNAPAKAHNQRPLLLVRRFSDGYYLRGRCDEPFMFLTIQSTRPRSRHAVKCHASSFACFDGQVAPMETVSVVYRLVPKVPGHVLLPKVSVVPLREKVRHLCE